jgi:hypothetical protein
VHAREYTLIGADGLPHPSPRPGTLGGNRRAPRIYGRLDCPSALRALARADTYARHRVFFADAATARAAGYRPCANCMPAEYAAWKSHR